MISVCNMKFTGLKYSPKKSMILGMKSDGWIISSTTVCSQHKWLPLSDDGERKTKSLVQSYKSMKVDQNMSLLTPSASTLGVRFITLHPVFSRNIGEVTLKIIYFHYPKKYFLDQSIQKWVYLILKTEALIAPSTTTSETETSSSLDCLVLLGTYQWFCCNQYLGEWT